MNEVFASYRKVQRLVASVGYGTETRAALLETVSAAAQFLTQAKRVELKSKVAGKTYFQFTLNNSTSRPVNAGLFVDDLRSACRVVELLFERRLAELTPERINNAVYSAAVSFCAVIDLTKERDQQTPGTFFQYFVSGLLTALLNCAPETSVQVLNLDFETKLPTDLIFDLGSGQAKYHVPVKTSTRERVIQVWAHQRVLDGVYGTGRFLGMPVILTETKLDSKKLEVTEICLPKQWLLYQMHIAQLWRIAFLDLPDSYANLSRGFPKVPVSTLGDVIMSGDLPIAPR